MGIPRRDTSGPVPHPPVSKDAPPGALDMTIVVYSPRP